MEIKNYQFCWHVVEKAQVHEPEDIVIYVFQIACSFYIVKMVLQ